MTRRKSFLFGGLLCLAALVGIASYNPVFGPVINNSVTFNGRVTINTNVTFTPFNLPQTLPHCWEFTATTAPNGLNAATVSTGSASFGFGTQSHWGMWAMTTGAGSGGAQGLNTQGVNIGVAGGNELYIWIRFQTPSALSDGTDTYTLYVLGGDSSTAEPANGAYILYTHSVNSGQWVFKTAVASSRTTVNSSSAVAASTWYDALLVCNAAGTEISSYISTDRGVTYSLLGSSSSNIPNGPPTGGAETFGPIVGIVKSAGTNARIVNVDRICIGYID